MGGRVEQKTPRPEPFIVWPENWIVFELLPLLQWRHLVGDRVSRVGFDQVAAWQLIDRHPQAPADKRQAFELFEDLVIASEVYCEIWNNHG